MKYLIVLIALTIANCPTVFGQDYIFMKDSLYEATTKWSFKLNGSFYGADPEIAVAKQAKGGYVMISIGVPFMRYYIGGDATIILNNGSTIKCMDSGMRDHVDNKSVALYNLTNSELEILQQHRIMRIRFTIKEKSNDDQNFTADNKKVDFSYDLPDNFKNYYETEVEVSNLFE